MPTVPTKKVSDVALRPAPTNYQAQSATSDAFGGQIARAQEQAAVGTQRIGQQLMRTSEQVADAVIADKQHTNNIAFDEAKVAYDARVKELLYGQNGLYTKKGRDAMDAAPVTIEEMKRFKGEVMSKYGPAVQERLGVSLDARINSYGGTINEFAIGQRNIYENQLLDSRKHEYGDDAARGYTNFDTINRSAAAVEAVTDDQSKRNGWAPEVTVSKMQEARTAVYKSAFDSAIKNGNVAQAKEILAKYKDKIDAPIADDMVRSLEVSSRLADAQATTDAIMAIPGIDTAERLKKAREIKDPEVRKEVETAVKTRSNEQAAAKKLEIEGYLKEASVFVQQGGTLAEWGKTNPEKYLHILADPDEKKKLDAAQAAVAEGRVYSRASDGETLLKYQSLPQSELAKMTPDQLIADRARLTEEEWGKLGTMVKAAKDASTDSSAGYGAFRRGEQVLKDFAPRNFGFDANSGKASNAQVQRMHQTKHQMNEFIQNHFDTYGKYPDNAAMVREANRLFLPLKSSGFFSWFGGGPDFAAELKGMTPEEKKTFKIDLSDVDPAVIQGVKQRFLDRGKPSPSDTTIGEFLGAEALNDKERQRALLGEGSKTPPPPTGSNSATERSARVPTISPPPIRVASNGTTAAAQPRLVGPVSKATGIEAQLSELISGHEGGFRAKVYKDSIGKDTIGIGFNLDRPGAKAAIEAVGADYEALKLGKAQLTEAQAATLFRNDVNVAVKTVSKSVKNFDSISDNRARVLIDMAFNLGADGFKSFEKMIKAVESNNFGEAARHMRKSDWAKQVGSRAKTLIKMMEEG